MLSFAKYLELRFYAGSYKRRASVEPCGHSLHKDHYQYFAYANMVASFKLVVALCILIVLFFVSNHIISRTWL